MDPALTQPAWQSAWVSVSPLASHWITLLSGSLSAPELAFRFPWRSLAGKIASPAESKKHSRGSGLLKLEDRPALVYPQVEDLCQVTGA